MKMFHQNAKSHAVYAYADTAFTPIDIHKELKKGGSMYQVKAQNKQTRRVVANENAQESDVQNAPGLVLERPDIDTSAMKLDFATWLPFSAPSYQISGNPEDHIIVPVVVMPTDLPNRNTVAFPLDELVKFNPELGMQAYKTWKGKPTHWEHENEDITRAKGVIADSSMRKLAGFSGDKLWKILLLLTFDRSKDPVLVRQILSGERNSYSMGAWVDNYTCSKCGAKLDQCSHLTSKNYEMYDLGGELVFRNCRGIVGFECSSVATPAYISAISDTRHELG